MARMGGKKHLKRLAAPAFWPILRKEYKWVVKPIPGPHPIERCLPLLIIIRDVLNYAETAKEARRIIAEGKIKIDGKIRRNYKFPVGLMDVIEIVPTKEFFRVVPHSVKSMTLVRISEEEAKFKLCKIENKTTVKKGHIQLNLHDGRNVIIKVRDPTNPVEDKYKTIGTLKLSIPEQEILEYIPFEKEKLAIVIGGRNVGRVGRIVDIQQGIGRKRTLVTLEDLEGNKFQTTLDKIFIIGDNKPLITIPEGVWR